MIPVGNHFGTVVTIFTATGTVRPRCHVHVCTCDELPHVLQTRHANGDIDGDILSLLVSHG